MTLPSEDEGLSLEQQYADGSSETIDPSVLFEYADFIASNYGMGSNKTLSEFVKSVNNEDPLVLEGMMNAAANRLDRMYGDGKSTNVRRNTTIDESLKQFEKTNNVKFHNERDKLVSFLKQMGASSDAIKEAVKEVDSGKIKISENDYSWITPETLWSPDFDFKGTLKKMSEDIKNSIKINVSGVTEQARKADIKKK